MRQKVRLAKVRQFILSICGTKGGLLDRPEYFIVPSILTADRVKDGHILWLQTPGKKGQPHQDTNMRQFPDREGEFLERWDLIK